jgi:hypothetical protein
VRLSPAPLAGIIVPPFIAPAHSGPPVRAQLGQLPVTQTDLRADF